MIPSGVCTVWAYTQKVSFKEMNQVELASRT